MRKTDKLSPSKGISKVSCEHGFYYVELDKLYQTGAKVLRCDDCGAKKTIDYLVSNSPMWENPTLCDAILAEPREVSIRTNLKKRRVYLKTKYSTEYAAQKKTLSVALQVFKHSPDWEDIFIQTRYKGGFVEAKVVKAELDTFLESVSLPKWYEKEGMPAFHKKEVLRYAALFCVSRWSRYIRPGSRLESFLAKLRGSKTF